MSCLYKGSEYPECEEIFNCCSCGGYNCGCSYCWDCHACAHCRDDWEEAQDSSECGCSNPYCQV